jgi:hypothetical protein
LAPFLQIVSMVPMISNTSPSEDSPFDDETKSVVSFS